jgi:GT2 family glycosyltransferase
MTTSPPRISVIIPVYNDQKNLAVCLQKLAQSNVPYECIVVDDGSTDDSASVGRQAGAKVISTAGRSGPAHARNIGAWEATSDLLLFLDADVAVCPDSLSRVIASFERDSKLDALFGSYDSQPEKSDFLSQYRNLMHHFVHQNAQRTASTFWTGFGAIRRTVFLRHDGFDARFGKPSVEDIDLGYRLRSNDCKIVLDPTLQVKHMKEWSLPCMIRTDLTQRAIPWTELILRNASMPNDLNVSTSQRISVALVFLLIALGALASLLNAKLFIPPLIALTFLLLSQYEIEITSGFRSKRLLGTGLFITALAITCFWSHQVWTLACSLAAFLLLLFRNHCYRAGASRYKLLDCACIVYFAGALLVVAIDFGGYPIAILFSALLGAVVLIDARFFAMLAAKHGRLYATAAVPFRLLFHLTCGIGFLIGFGRFILSMKVRPPMTPSLAVSRRSHSTRI